MFLIYDKSDQKKFILHKSLIIFWVLLSLPLAAHWAKVEVPDIKTGFSLGLGWIIILVVGALAFFNRLKLIFKIKSLGFVIAFIIITLVRVGIDALWYSLGLISIPLLIDDIIIKPYWKAVEYKKYHRKPRDNV